MNKPLTIYLVGGAVRDTLIGRPVTERDYVVVGSTPEQMTALGFKAVGKDFPVFLHPKTKEEYALARTEKKVARGYQGFEFYTSPDVTLEQDLARRDLTINAIAQDSEGQLVDPYHGADDIKNKLFRHVSPAFSEDPVRILRLARFAARFPEFRVHPDTRALMQAMSANGEVDALVAERVFQELNKALSESAPQRFFDVLNDSHALARCLPELCIELIDTEALTRIVASTPERDCRFSVLCAQLDRDTTLSLCQRIKTPKPYKELALLVQALQPLLKDINDTEALLSILEKTDAFRRPERLQKSLTALEAINQQVYSETVFAALQAAKTIVISELAKQYQGQELARAIRQARRKAIASRL